MIDTTYNNISLKFGNKQITPKEKNFDKTKAIIGATIGTAIPLTFMLKKQQIKNPFKLEYGLKDMLILSTSSIAGGTIGGMHKENKDIKKSKLKEGIFQLLNSTLPSVCVAGMLKLSNSHQKLNNVPCKITSVILGIGIGMLTAIKLANKIFDPKDEYPDRKIGVKDFIANSDDAIGALALAKFPIINKLKIDKALPLIYGYCGYRAGNAE